jgi:hypothetical protein
VRTSPSGEDAKNWITQILVGCKMNSHPGKLAGLILFTKLNMQLPYKQATVFLNTYPRKMKSYVTEKPETCVIASNNLQWLHG